jgi:hypothetical protein
MRRQFPSLYWGTSLAVARAWARSNTDRLNPREREFATPATMRRTVNDTLWYGATGSYGDWPPLWRSCWWPARIWPCWRAQDIEANAPVRALLAGAGDVIVRHVSGRPRRRHCAHRISERSTLGSFSSLLGGVVHAVGRVQGRGDPRAAPSVDCPAPPAHPHTAHVGGSSCRLRACPAGVHGLSPADVGHAKHAVALARRPGQATTDGPAASVRTTACTAGDPGHDPADGPQHPTWGHRRIEGGPAGVVGRLARLRFGSC